MKKLRFTKKKNFSFLNDRPKVDRNGLGKATKGCVLK